MRRPLRIGGALVLLALALLVAVAQAAAPSLRSGVAYSTGKGRHQVGLTFVTSVRTPNRVEEGEAAAGSQFAISEGSLLCPKAKHNPGFTEVPFALFGLPGTTLHQKHGAYAFKVKIRAPQTVPLGADVQPFTLKVTLTGTVVSKNEISGTVSASGGPCKTKKPLSYTATYDPSLPVAPQ